MVTWVTKYRLWIVGLGCSLVALLMFMNHPYNADEGVVLNAAWQLWHGKTMYTEFVSFMTPGSAYLVYVSWWLVGQASYAAIRLVVIGLVALSTTLIWVVVYQSQRNWLMSSWVALAWLWCVKWYPLINHNTLSSLLALFLFMFIWVAQQRKLGWYWYSLAGLMASGVFLFLQTKGVVIILATVLVIWLRRDLTVRRRGLASAVMLLGCSVPVIICGLVWTPAIVWNSWFVLPGQTQYLAHTFFNPYIIILGIGIVGALGYALYRKPRYVLQITLVWQVALFASMINLIDIGHFTINIFPALIILGVICTADTVRLYQRYALNWIAVGMIVGIICTAIINLLEYNIITGDLLQWHRSPLVQVQSLVQTTPYIYAGPFLPQLYFELRKPNPFTGIDNLVLCSNECQQQAEVIFQQVQPQYALTNYALVKKYGYKPNHLIEQDIQQHYQACVPLKGLEQTFQLWSRGACPESKNML